MSIKPYSEAAKGVLKICSKFTGEHPSQSVIFIKLPGNFIEITLRHGCSPVNLLHIFRTIFPRNTSGWLLLHTEFAFMSQKQFSRGALKKRRSENMQRIYKRTPMSKYDFIKVALRLYWNHISVWVFSYKNTSGGLLLLPICRD